MFGIDAAQPVPVKSGGVVIFHPLAVHSSLENTSDGIRWSFDLRYNVTGDPVGWPTLPSFVARRAVNSASELHDSEPWQALWLDARDVRSNENSVEIHRWDGSSVVYA